MCKPKETGGFNFRDLVCFNQAMLVKQVWRVLDNPNLSISKILRGIYFPSSSVLDASAGSSSSYILERFCLGDESSKEWSSKKYRKWDVH